MYLKKIEVQGFKSFANKMLFEFDNGITGIVGPNGSGKSNISDAIRWVLGEQSAKQLRGSKMEDVIFAGTQMRKPVSFASVSLTIDNSDHRLDVAYDEVTVARRVYRSGESEYYLNGNACRLKDINELFYAQRTGCAEKNITVTEDPAIHATPLYELAAFCGANDLTVQENYEAVTTRLDIDSFIDWLIMEGYCCNADVAGNLTWLRGVEMGNLWQPALYDLDSGFYYRDGFANVLNPESPQQYAVIAAALMKNTAFRTLFLQRLQAALEGPLSGEAVLARIDELEALLAPEVSRERAKWGGTAESWQADVERLRSYLTRYDHIGMLVQSLRDTIGLTDEEANTYFGR